MATAPTATRLIAAAVEAAEHAKSERAKAMDAIVDLLWERAEMRDLMRSAVPFLLVVSASADIGERMVELLHQEGVSNGA